jgi:hypothetical protein
MAVAFFHSNAPLFDGFPEVVSRFSKRGPQ